MAEKYQARSNGVEGIEEVPQKTKKQERQESSTKVAKVAFKGLAEGAAHGVGGKAVDMISQTPLGQKALNNAGKSLAANPIAGRVFKKLDDKKVLDVADKATNLIGGKPSTSNIGNTSNTLNPNNSGGLGKNPVTEKSNNQLNSNDNSDKEQASNDSSLDQMSNSKKGKDNDLLGNLFGNGSIMKLIKTKYLLIGCGVCFGFILMMTLFVSAKDFGNLDMTNKSNAMGNYSPELIGVVSTDTITQINDDSLDGGASATILSGGNTLYSIMGESGVQLLNLNIQSSAQLAGYGTGAAPAAAAQALIQNLLNVGVILPYFWGGGHGAISTGADGNWGTYTKVTASGSVTSYSKQPLGLDCSGFVSWALYNGGCKNFSPITAAAFKNLGPETSFSNAKMGDIAASNTHVVLVLENRGDNLLVAEAKGINYGVVFSLRNEKNLKKYKIVDMSSYYQANCS